jgi:ribose-phosphate pyrophosphokinase
VLRPNQNETVAARAIERIVTPHKIPRRPAAPDNLVQLSCAELLTDSIRRIFTDDSVSEVFGGENQLF